MMVSTDSYYADFNFHLTQSGLYSMLNHKYQQKLESKQTVGRQCH